MTGLLLLATACSTPSDKVFIQKAQDITNQLLDTMAEQRYGDAIKYYAPRFFERISPDEWQIALKKLTETLGSYQSRKMTASRVTYGFSTISTATTVLVYRVYYQKSYTIQKFTFLSDEQAGNMVLVGHYIDYPDQEKQTP